MNIYDKLEQLSLTESEKNLQKVKKTYRLCYRTFRRYYEYVCFRYF